MSTTPAAVLARLKAEYPGWSISRVGHIPPRYAAVSRAAEPVYLSAGSAAELAGQLAEATLRVPQRARNRPSPGGGDD